jgi:hypothetical protein
MSSSLPTGDESTRALIPKHLHGRNAAFAMRNELIDMVIPTSCNLQPEDEVGVTLRTYLSSAEIMGKAERQKLRCTCCCSDVMTEVEC